MYMIYINADDDKIRKNGMEPEDFWATVKANLKDCGFIQLKEDPHYFAEWEEKATLGHCWAIQSAFANDLPEVVNSMTEYTLYEVGRVSKPVIREEDKERFTYLKSFDEFSDEDIAFKRNANYLDNMLHEIELIKEKGKRKKQPIKFNK